MNSLINFMAGLIELGVFIAVIFTIVALWGYNRIRRLSEDVKEAWSNITVAMKKKVSLVNQLIDTVRSYQESEKLVMLKLSEDLTVSSFGETYQQSGAVLSAISGMAQRYPELKFGEQYHRLADSIQQSEATIESARTRYNMAVKEYNVARTSIPHVFYARLMGFGTAMYLNLDAAEDNASVTQRPIISDDGERVNELLGMAGSKVVGAAKRLADQGRLLGDKGAARMHQTVGAEFHYLDADRNPQGPVTRVELDHLFQAGKITADTDLLTTGSKSWKKYRDLLERRAAQACGSCGTPLSPGDIFCSECGTRSGAGSG